MWVNNSILQAACVIFVAAVSYGSVLPFRMPRVNSGSPVSPDVSPVSSDFQCTRKGSFPVPGSCQEFYECDDVPGYGFIATRMSCPPGSTFDDLFNVCNPGAQLTIRTDCVTEVTDAVELRLDNSPALQRPRRFIHINIERISIGSIFDLVTRQKENSGVDLTKIENKLDGINGRMKDIDSSVLESRIENAVNAKLTQNLIRKGIRENEVNFKITQDLIGQSILENRLNAALTQGLIIQGHVASDMNFARVQGSIGEVRTFIEDKMSEAKSDMEKGFQSITAAIDRVRTEELISKFLRLIEGYHEKVEHLLALPEHRQPEEMKRDRGYITYLENNSLEDTLRDVINQRLAVPADASDTSSVIILDLLVEGFRIHANMLTHIISSNIYLAGKALKDRELEDFDTYMSRAISDITRMNLKLGFDTDGGLSQDVIQVLTEVRQLPYVSQIRGLTELLSEKESALNQTKFYIKKFNTAHTYLAEPGKIPKKLDFTGSSIALPIGSWRQGAQIEYTVQVSSSEGMSEIAEWSRPYTIYNRANPIVHLPSAGEGTTRLVYRRFDGDTPELVARVTDREQSSFRDIDRDMLNAASRPNEDLAVHEVQALLDDGANINAMLEHNMTPLHYAAKFGNLKVIEILLDKGADLHAKTLDDENALHYAALHDHNEVLEFLLSKGSLIDAPTKVLGWTPLHVAAVNDYGDATRTLISNGASINAKDSNGLTPLHLATLGNGEALEVLLGENEIDVNAKADDGQTPLHYIARSSNTHVANTLLGHGNTEVNAYADGLLSPLHFAAMSGSVDTVSSLIQHGASPFIFDKEGSTPLHYAAFFGNEEAILKLLEENQFVESAKNWDKKYAFDLAVETKKATIISKLRNGSEFVKEEFEQEYLAGTGISLPDVDCTHGMAQEMATGSEETCIHVGRITSYIEVIKSKQELPVSEDHGAFSQTYIDYNNALQRANSNAADWTQGDSILKAIQKAFRVAKEFEGEFEKEYRNKQRRLSLASLDTESDKLEAQIAFLEHMKKYASEIEQTAAAAKQRCVLFRHVLETETELLKKVNDDAKQLFSNLEDQYVGRDAALRYFIERQEELKKLIAKEKQHIPSVYEAIYESYKQLRDIRMKIIQKIHHVPTQRFATTLSSPSLSYIIAQPLLTLETSEEKEQIKTLEKSIVQEREKVKQYKSNMQKRETLVSKYQRLIIRGRGNTDLEEAYATATKMDCVLQDIKRMVPSVQSSFSGITASLETVETTFSKIRVALSAMINAGKTAATVEEKGNTLSSINRDLSELQCHWKETGVMVADLKECSNNVYFIFPKPQLESTQC